MTTEKMTFKVFQVATAFSNWGGMERHILVLSEELKRRGHDVGIIVRPKSWVEEQAALAGTRTFPIRIMKQSDRQDLGRLTEIFSRERPDVVHVHCTSDIMTVGIAARRAGVPVKVISHHLPKAFRNRLGSFIYTKLLFQKVVPVSESVGRAMLACGVPAKKIEVIHHGTDVDAFSATRLSPFEMRAILGIPPEAVAIGIVGRISIEKGHNDFVRAIAGLKYSGSVYGVIIGDGDLADDLRQLCCDLGVQDRIIWTGFRNDVNEVMNALDIVAVPSTWDEPCSAVIQQGMALNKPVVGTRVGGTPEMIVDGVTGLLVPPGDPACLTGAFETLVRDEQSRMAMGTAGRRRVEKYFTLGLMVDRLERLYGELYHSAAGRKRAPLATANRVVR